MNRHTERRNDKINSWFYERQDRISPATTVMAIADEFCAYVESQNLKLSLPFKDFRNLLCEATCVMFRAHLEGRLVICPDKIPNLPSNWNRETEEIWNDHLGIFYLTDDFWTDFWRTIQPGIWEAQFPDYRYYIQGVMPLYIKRDIDLLIEEGLIKKNSEGEYVDIHDEDADWEDESYPDDKE
jgi:hypothetical protein